MGHAFVRSGRVVGRRRWIRSAGALTVVAAAGPWVLGGCDEEVPATPGCGGDGGAIDAIASSIGSNHGHALDVGVAALVRGTSATFAMSSGAGHTHDLRLSAAQVDALLDGTVVVAISTSNDAHMHTVTLRPACS